MEKIYTKLKNMSQVKEVIKEMLVFLDKTDNKLMKISYYNKLQKLYFEDEEYEKAYECQKKIQNILD
ncbi:hypothetical protein SDC9_114474 [bioreactor metagenome]|uniref:Uncharacterized protein n=1 Tax=bioreactor metagenome TaxID=1076179 RepID=A0A645BSH0_9ZZZZ